MHGGVRIILALATALPVSLSAGAASAAPAWKAEELNWYGISQRRINETRADSGLALLAAEPYLFGLARERARDMASRGYLSGATPEGLDAGAYMAQDGARYERWSELRAEQKGGHTEEQVAWNVINTILNDPAGRAAVVGPFDRLGVGMAGSSERAVFVILLARSAPPPSIVEVIRAAALRHGVDPTYLVRVARCESGLNPRAHNPAGPYFGLFQFHPRTFAAYGGRDIYSPEEQAEIAARMFARGLAAHWPVCGRGG